MADQLEVRLNGPSRPSEMSGLSLTIGGRDIAMSYRIDALSRTFVSALPPVVHDLLDIAGTVYAADCAVSRGGLSDEGMGRNWRRVFNLTVPVRDPERWSRATVTGALTDCLGFLSDDFWSFDFRQAETVAPRQGLFDFSDQPDFGPTRVQMFSGGLDSLAGALEELIEREERVVLVSHGSATKLAPVQKRLVDAMRKTIKADRLRHVSVKAQLANRARREGTQRSRSFLFAALGMAVARGYGLDRISFFENGVVSLNLPPVAQVVGARATRTTHPKVLKGFERLFRALFDTACEVRNPYALRTKTEIVGTIRRLGFAEQIRDAHSCADVHNRTTMHSHCGRCSQCVDRRIAVLAEGQGANDPVEAYASDPLRGARPQVTDKEMVLSYVRNARFYAVCAPEQFLRRFPEALAAVSDQGGGAPLGLRQAHDLHRRHGMSVKQVIETELYHVGATVSAPDSLLALYRAAELEMYLAGAQVPNDTAAPDPEPVLISIDRTRKRARIGTATDVSGAMFSLLVLFADAHLKCLGDGLAPEDFTCLTAETLRQQMDFTDESSVRRKVKALRRRFDDALRDAQVETADIVENLPRYGYRLNPYAVKVQVVPALPGVQTGRS